MRRFVLGFALVGTTLWVTPGSATATPAQFLFQKRDRVAWVGSSSTKIGVWPRTVEFLLRTRHPQLRLEFQRFTTGGGTFATGRDHLDGWLNEFQPTVVVLNYGGNDSGAGQSGLRRFVQNMEECVGKVRAQGARVALVTPQALDSRKCGSRAASRATLYAETMLAFGRRRGWTVVDVHHPLDALQRAQQQVDPGYSILRDPIHLTDPAYVAWGFYMYDRLDPPFARSAATLTDGGGIVATENCHIHDVEAGQGFLSFTRHDRVLPILPPSPLPPRMFVPLEVHSRYLLTITGLPPGQHEVRCEGQIIGVVDAQALALGVNLNSVLLEQGREAPWRALSQALWDGQMVDRVGWTRWRFEVRPR